VSLWFQFILKDTLRTEAYSTGVYCMKILMATSEFAPLVSTGDLGEQVAKLTAELRKLGHDVSVVLPLYRSIRATEPKSTGVEFQVSLGAKKVSAEIFESTAPSQIFLVRKDEYFDRSGIYSGNGKPYEDNSERFIFFARAAAELASRLSPAVDVIHCHDWPAALVPVFVRDQQLPFRTVLTIHNLEHQGSFWSFDFALTGLPGSYFSPRGVEFYGRLNFLKGGILAADAVTFPGEVGLFEAFAPQHGFGLDVVLRENQGHLFGIPHGVDYSQSNPPLPAQKGRRGNGKAAARQNLLGELGLDSAVKGPVIALPVDPSDAAAFNQVAPILDLILTSDACLIVTGETLRLPEILVAERKYPTRFAYRSNPDQALLQRVLAGADFALFPGSVGYRGVTLQTALRYGTLPVVRADGGIHQLVTDYDPLNDTGYGFIYQRNSSRGLWDAVRRASQLYRKRDSWNALVSRAKAVDFSWVESAKAFAALYANLLRHREAA
jgi:starch synthase